MIKDIQTYLLDLQMRICSALEQLDGKEKFQIDRWQRKENNISSGITSVMTDGCVFEKAGVNFSKISGAHLAASANASRPELSGRSFSAIGLSLVLHPLNPFAPTAHMNVRFFSADKKDKAPIWWFGGGFDLTPYYGFKQDAVHWHKSAQAACIPFGLDVYPRYKKWCDDYFYLKHRSEPRGIGGLFFDDLNAGGFEHCFAFIKAVGEAFLDAYLPIIKRRKDIPYNEENIRWQHYRRGRYVEFNLVYDRGTLFGLQTGGRTESILISMPPQVSWKYQYKPRQNSPEIRLYEEFLIAKDWLA